MLKLKRKRMFGGAQTVAPAQRSFVLSAAAKLPGSGVARA